MKLEELSRAALAEANYKKRVEDILVEQHVLEGENLGLQVIDNSDREFQSQKMSENEGGNMMAKGGLKTGGTKGHKKAGKGSKLSRELKRISLK